MCLDCHIFTALMNHLSVPIHFGKSESRLCPPLAEGNQLIIVAAINGKSHVILI